MYLKSNIKKVVIVDGRKCSKPISKDKWCRHLVCECGSVYGKYKWRTNKNGEVSNGYQCRHQIRYRKRSFHEKQGLDGTGYCNVPSICEWKLDFMLCNMMQNIKDRYKAFKKSVRFDGQIIEISGKEYADMVMKYALMLPEYNVKKAEKELQDFKDNKINLLTNKEVRKNKVEKVAKGTGEVVKEAIVYTGGSLVKNTIKSILHIS